MAGRNRIKTSRIIMPKAFCPKIFGLRTPVSSGKTTLIMIWRADGTCKLKCDFRKYLTLMLSWYGGDAKYCNALIVILSRGLHFRTQNLVYRCKRSPTWIQKLVNLLSSDSSENWITKVGNRLLKIVRSFFYSSIMGTYRKSTIYIIFFLISRIP